MSETHATTPLSKTDTAELPSELPASIEAFHAALQTERERVLTQAAADMEAAVADAVARAMADRDAEIEARVAAGVSEKLLQFFEQWRLARHKMFGPSSESRQGELFNEVEALADQAGDAQDPDEGVAPTSTSQPAKAQRGHRRALPPELPRVEMLIDVPEDKRKCACGTAMVRIGEDVSEQLDIIPMKIRVLRTVRPRYACPKGDQAPVQQPAPAQVLPRSNFGPGILAMMAVTKYVDGLPLARFEKVLARHHVQVTRQSMARAMIRLAQALQPLHNLARDALLEGHLIHMDETTIQVLKEPGRNPSSKSYMWVQRGGPPGRQVVLFDYDPSRSGQVPLRLLEGWRGYLMTDGYEGYAALARTPGVEHLACMAHARRKFIEAKRAGAKGKSARADHALDLIGRLYRIEARLKDATDAQRLAGRQEHSLAVLETLRNWLDDTLAVVAPKGKLGEALGYLHKIWPRLVRYTERGDLPVDNNLAYDASAIVSFPVK